MPVSALPVVAVVLASALTGCGGGGSDGPPTDPDSSRSDANQNDPNISTVASTFPRAHLRSGRNNTLGIGPAFLYESPNVGDLATSTRNVVGGVTETGFWRDPQGRDGSASAGEVLRFLQTFEQEWRNPEDRRELVIVRTGPNPSLTKIRGEWPYSRIFAIG